MALHSFESDRFSKTEQEHVVGLWRARYDELVQTLGQLGSLVMTRRTLENDQDIPPRRFVRGATHLFVFPPQPVSLARRESNFPDPSPGYELERQIKLYDFSWDGVECLLGVTYDDSEGQIRFAVYDHFGADTLPLEVTRALNTAFDPPES